MSKSMTRGKQQVLFNYLPGKTFDFERGPIARVVRIRGFEQAELNLPMIVSKVSEQAKAWPREMRPALGDHLLDDPSKFVLLDPQEVDAEMFPRVFWCTNTKCGKVTDWSNRNGIPSSTCEACKSGKLSQLRFVRVHRCGAIEPLTPPPLCPHCKGRDFNLITRESERLSAFRWVCRKCHHAMNLFGGKCRHCEWPDEENPNASTMDIEVHRAGRTYYPQNTVLLNIPKRELEGLIGTTDWQCVAAAKFLNLPAAKGRRLSEFFSKKGTEGIQPADLERFLQPGIDPSEAMEKLRAVLAEKKASASPTVEGICEAVVAATGVSHQVWRNAGPQILEAIIPFEGVMPPARLSAIASLAEAHELSKGMGIEEIALAPDYTVINATFGYSRAGYKPTDCWLNPFPAEQQYKGRLPIYVDRVEADALIISLDPERVLEWLSANGLGVPLPAVADSPLAARGYFVNLFENSLLYHTLGDDRPELRMVFGLLHSLSHQCIRQASLLCGLDRTSLSEYLIPRTLTIAIYCNHRFGATIGALTALFEQTLHQWLAGIRETRNCVYDPVCHDHDGSCHACTHLAETSCRFFNLNLSRSFLFGGPDRELGRIARGYFELAKPA